MPSEFKPPEFLQDSNGDASDNEPTQRIRCPVHGFIRYSNNERLIIDHRLFRRLRSIRQLALTEYLYPGACHTRFEHSLGVMQVATLAFDHLAESHGATMQRLFGQAAVYDFDEGSALAKARQAIRLAALIHDLGHSPFSHAVESIIHEDFGHEKLSIDLAILDRVSDRENTGDEPVDGLRSLLNGIFWDGCAKTVGDLIAGQLPPQLMILRDIISGELDADRTDYLIRDSLHCGVEYGRFDFRRLIETLAAVEDEGALRIGIHEAGMHTFEALILARYQLSTQVLNHPVRRIYDYYLSEYLKALPKEFMNTPRKILSQDDFSMLVKIRESADRGPADLGKWAQRIVNRNHHRLIHGLGICLDANQVKAGQKACESLRKEYPDIDFVFDSPSRGVKIHKIAGSNRSVVERNELGLIDFHVVTKSGRTRNINECSPIFDTLRHQFDLARIYADLQQAKKASVERSEIESAAQKAVGEAGGR